MNKIIAKIIATVMIPALCIGFINVNSFAYSAIPDYFDFGDCVVSVDAGATREIPIRATYDYKIYVGNHTSTGTYADFSGKAGYETVRLHIGRDETEKNVFFYFYVRDSREKCDDIYDAIEVYVQNIDTEYSYRSALAAPLKGYAFNNSEFNAYNYYMNYPDLRAAFGTDADALYNHYYTNGKFESRVANRLI